MPKLGLISDSHARARLTGVGASLLVRHGADRLVHLGDICSQTVLDALVQPGVNGGIVPVDITWGNNDPTDGPENLTRYAQSLGIGVHYPSGVLFSGSDCPVGFTHGHLPSESKWLVKQGCRYLLHGHTHVARDEVFGAVRVINPGALHRVSAPTVALLDTDLGTCQFFELPRE